MLLIRPITQSAGRIIAPRAREVTPTAGEIELVRGEWLNRVRVFFCSPYASGQWPHRNDAAGGRRGGLGLLLRGRGEDGKGNINFAVLGCSNLPPTTRALPSWAPQQRSSWRLHSAKRQRGARKNRCVLDRPGWWFFRGDLAMSSRKISFGSRLAFFASSLFSPYNTHPSMASSVS